MCRIMIPCVALALLALCQPAFSRTRTGSPSCWKAHEVRCACPVCARFSRGYLNHVFRSKDMLGGSLLTLHNMHYFQRLMVEIREAIAAGTFGDLRRRVHEAYPQTEPGKRPRPRD